MKKIFLSFFVFYLFTACTEDKSNETTTQEESSTPAPDNSNATNPSLPDTVYQADSIKK